MTVGLNMPDYASRLDLPQYVQHSDAQSSSSATEVTYQSMKIALESCS